MNLRNSSSSQESRRRWTVLWVATGAHAVAWITAAGFAFVFVNRETGIAISFLGALSIITIYLALRSSAQRRWIEPLTTLARDLERGSSESTAGFDEAAPEIAGIARSIRDFQARLQEAVRQGVDDRPQDSGAGDTGSAEIDAIPVAPDPALTASGLYAGWSVSDSESPDRDGGEMISKLHPRSLVWIDSSPSERVWLGLSAAALANQCYLDFIHPEDRGEAERSIRLGISRRESHGLRYRIRNARGEDRDVEVDLSMRFNRDGSPRYVRLRTNDVTERVKADRELRRKTGELSNLNAHLMRMNRDLELLSSRYADLYHNVPVMYFSLDKKARITQCNTTMARVLGYPREQLIGSEFRAVVDPDQRGELVAWSERLRSEGSAEASMRWRKANGETLDVRLASRLMTRADGCFDSARNVALDETERLRLEGDLRINNARLEQANAELLAKNRELDEFSYVVSHDLQEPVRTLINFAGFLLEDHAEALDETGREHLGYIVEASRRLRAMIQDLLSLSRAGRAVGELRVLDPTRIVDSARRDLDGLIRSKHGRVVVRNDLPTIAGDEVRIRQLFVNLIGNALKYNRSAEPLVEIDAGRVEGGFVEISVSDNGIGIAPEFRGKIFELFRRLHPRDEFEGTGAGLAICRKIVEAHGGRIGVEGRESGGSRFSFTLPTADGAPIEGPDGPHDA